MAEDMVLWENLDRTLNNIPVLWPLPLREELERLQAVVGGSRGAMVALERCDRIQIDLMRGRVENLSTLLHQADDILDQILTVDLHSELCRGERRTGNGVARIAGEVSSFLVSPIQIFFLKKMAGQLHKISNSLENLVGQLVNEVDCNVGPDRGALRQIPCSRLVEERVIERVGDKMNIIKMLLKPSIDIVSSNVSVVYMSGLPGVGKSVLAKEIYADHQVKNHFDLRLWIPVSQITDPTEIIREIVESCTNRRSNYSDKSRAHLNDRNSFRDLLGCRSSSIATSGLPRKNAQHNEIDIYERRLRKEISGKLFLLVLDNVCLQKWRSLIELLGEGARGSQILVTSRLAEIADLVMSETVKVKSYPLQGLSEKHSLTLFRTLASHHELRETELEIVELSQHVPFAVKISARFLQGKTKDECLLFLDGLRWIEDEGKDILEHVLDLTYSDLPSRLRACFGYCSLFPDDFTFKRHDLISMWIAQGFVIPYEGQSVEEAGEMYFEELSWRCLFEEVSTDELGNILTCKMHHIVGSLASKFTTGVANIHMTDSGMIQVPDRTSKHVSINCRGDSSLKFSSSLLNCPNLRTLIFIKDPDCYTKVDTFVSHQLISKYKGLRVLDMHDLGIKELPDSIGEQIHLRYLDLSKNDGLSTIPKSVARLYNLQTLKLNSCPKLKRIAADFGLLVNLKRLEVDECDMLTCMPLGLERLTQLETLSRFVVGCGSSLQSIPVGLKALGELTQLRGRLAIELRGAWMTNIPTDATLAFCRESQLVEVKISWVESTSDHEVPLEDEVSAHENILAHLQPNPGLKILYIEGYKGKDFPSWAKYKMINHLPNLVIITIEGCSECQFLPLFGELSHLKKLTLRHMPNVQYIEDTISLDSPIGRSQEHMHYDPFFLSLQELTLHNFCTLEGWWNDVEVLQDNRRFFPCLSKLSIWNCPNLRWFPSFPKVSDLNLCNVNQLLFRNRPSFLDRFCTERLKISGCPNLKDFVEVRKGLGYMNSLKHLVIESCDALTSLVAEFRHLTSIERLEILSCKELNLSEYSKRPLEYFRSPPWKNLRFLRELILREIPKLETLPEGLKHVKSLKTLWISACRCLGSLPEWMSSLTSLQYLRIESCRSLKRLPKGLMDIRSLMKVEITDCPELMERCREPNGEDWPKIKHARVLLHKSWRYGYES